MEATQQPRQAIENIETQVEEPETQGPIQMVIPVCSVCKAQPKQFPVLTCESCWGKTVICVGCASLAHPHKTHRLRAWLDGVWFDVASLNVKTVEAPTDQYGPLFEITVLENLQLGYNVLENACVLMFGPRPSGDLRLFIKNAPPGAWEVTAQITTWPSPNFGDAEVRMLRLSKRLSVNVGTTGIGFVDAWIGTPVGEQYIDEDMGNPIQVSVWSTVLDSMLSRTSRLTFYAGLVWKLYQT